MKDKRRLDDFNELIGDIQTDGFYYENPREKREMIAKRLLQIADTELTHTQREVIMGIYFEKLTVNELAAHLGVCPSAVYRTHKRAIEKIKKYSRYMSLRS